MTISIGNNAMTGLLSIGEVSIDTAIQTIQKERATLLNGPLMNSVKAVQSRNDQITKLNDVLVSLEGRMYTGCDLNSTLEDMEYLSRKSPYILAAIGNADNCAY